MFYRCLRSVHQADVRIQVLYQDDASFVAELEARGQAIEMCLLHLDARFVTDTFMDGVKGENRLLTFFRQERFSMRL